MKSKYNSNNYPDTYKTYNENGEQITMVELTMGCFQMFSKNFEIPGVVDDPRKNSYYLSFFVTFKFVSYSDNIFLDKISFSFSGSQSNSFDHLDFKEHDEKEEFCDFIKKQYIKNFFKTKNFISDKVIYHINEKDQKKIKESFQYLEQIFPNNKEVVIIDLPKANFYKGNDNTLDDAVLIYENSRTFFAFKDLEKKFPIKEISIKTKKNKI